MSDTDPLPYTSIAPLACGNEEHDALHLAMRTADNAWRAARATRAPDDDVRRLARAYIAASEAFQRARFGSVRVRASLGALLR